MAEDRRLLVSNSVLQGYKNLQAGKSVPDPVEDHPGRKPLQGDWYNLLHPI